MTDQEVLKLIQSNEQALRENLLASHEAEEIQKALARFLDEHLPKDSITGLRYRKLKTDKRLGAWWKGPDGYPMGNTWSEKFVPLINILEQYLAEKTIKKRLEIEGLFIESRQQGEGGDEHLIIGEKDGTGEKAHVVIDSATGEIRVKEKGKEPTELTRRIETILTLKSGKRVKTSREAIELMDEETPEIILQIELDRAKITFDSTLKPKGGPADHIFIQIPVKLKNMSDGKLILKNVVPHILLPEGYTAGLYSHGRSQVEFNINGKEFSLQTFHFFSKIISGSGPVNSQNLVYEENRKKILSNLPTTKAEFRLTGECTSFDGTIPIDKTFDITEIIVPQLKL